MQPITENRFSEASYKRNYWNIILPFDAPYEDLFAPGYWSHIAEKLRPMDRIEVFREDGTEWAELLVTLTDRVSAKVIELNRVSLEKEDPVAVDPEYSIAWAGPHHKFRIIRLSDKEVVQPGFATAAEAQRWLHDYTKALAA